MSNKCEFLVLSEDEKDYVFQDIQTGTISSYPKGYFNIVFEVGREYEFSFI